MLSSSPVLATPMWCMPATRVTAPVVAAVPIDDDDDIIRSILRWHKADMPTIEEHIVRGSEDGERLLRVSGNVFKRLGSKSQAKEASRRGRLLVNGEAVETSRRLRAGDVLSLKVEPTPPPTEAKLHGLRNFVIHLRSQGLRVPYEDADVAVVYKPPGIHVKVGTNHRWSALEDALPAELSPPPAGAAALPSPLVMHRLDVPVSGLCLVAKTREGALSLSRQFESRSISKTYHALLVGRVEAEGTLLIDDPIGGRAAQSEVELLSVIPHPQWGSLSTVRMRPLTGRTHQLRLHAAVALGCPIVGDDLYWAAAAEAQRARGLSLPALRKTGGLFLQSCGVRFEHPDGSRIEVSVPEARKFGQLRLRATKGSEYQQEQPE
jgi:23S rRNA pseudouridine1911/1915/1917 synthase